MSSLPPHPAKFSPEVLDALRLLVKRESKRLGVERPRLLDSFAGTGRIHQLEDVADTTGVELQPRWAAYHSRTRVGDATALPRHWRRRFHLWATSPCYGNRYSDHHVNRDPCRKCKGTGALDVELTEPCPTCRGSGLSVRHSYTHDYGEPLEVGNAGVMRFGSKAYEELHLRAYRQAWLALVPGGGALLNVSNFVRDKEIVDAVSWHRWALLQAGFRLRSTSPVDTRRMKFGTNRDARAGNEVILVARKPEELT